VPNGRVSAAEGLDKNRETQGVCGPSQRRDIGEITSLFRGRGPGTALARSGQHDNTATVHPVYQGRGWLQGNSHQAGSWGERLKAAKMGWIATISPVRALPKGRVMTGRRGNSQVRTAVPTAPAPSSEFTTATSTCPRALNYEVRKAPKSGSPRGRDTHCGEFDVNVSLIDTTRTFWRKTFRAAMRFLEIALHRCARIC
jgi:hypothetical protein